MGTTLTGWEDEYLEAAVERGLFYLIDSNGLRYFNSVIVLWLGKKRLPI